jgi:hypothetical protein
MTLPASYGAAVEAEALQFARDFLARAQEGDFMGLGNPPLGPMADHVFARRWCKFCAALHPQGAEQVVDLAITYGERSAHEALVELIDEKTDRYEPLGAVLGAYSIRLRRVPFHAHSGPARTTLIEDVVFSILILQLVERFHLNPTRYRDRKHERPSACSIAARAAADMGLHRGDEDAFRKIWKRVAPRLLPGMRFETAEALAILKPHCR